MTTSPEEVANRTTEQFADKIFQAALGTMETLNLYLGDQLGWFDALAVGPATAGELAEQTKTQPRYAIEWLEMQAVYGMSLSSMTAVAIASSGVTPCRPARRRC